MHRRTPSNRLSLLPQNPKNSISTTPSTNTNASMPSSSFYRGTMNTPPLPVTSLLHPFSSPRKHRLKHRTTIFALFGLVALTCYVLFILNPTLDISKPLRTHVQDHDRVYAYNDENQAAQKANANANVPEQQSASYRNSAHRKTQPQLQPVPVAPQRPQISLTPSEELAALSAFLAALPHNVLPATVDPKEPLDPQLVLDFDPRSERAREELNRVVEEVWSRYPVMLFTKLHSADSREVRYMLSNMHLQPSPLVFEVDQREDAPVLIPLLNRLTHVPTLPILLIGGQPVGTEAEDTKSLMAVIRGLHESGELSRMVLEAGAKLDSGKRRGRKGK